MTNNFVNNSKNNNTNKEEEIQSTRSSKLLDVGCGTGGLAIHAFKDGYDVTAIDSSPAMVSYLSQRFNSLILTENQSNMITNNHNNCNNNNNHNNNYNINTIGTFVVNGQSLNKEWTDTFDYVVSSFSLIFFPKPEIALQEIYRCLLPSSSPSSSTSNGARTSSYTSSNERMGGKVVISGWGDRSDSPAFRIIPDAVSMVAPELVSSSSSSQSSLLKKKQFLSNPEDLKPLLVQAGFVDIHIVHNVTRTMTFLTPLDYYQQFALKSPIIRSMISWMEQQDANNPSTSSFGGKNDGDGTLVQKFQEKVLELVEERCGGHKDGSIKIVSPAYFVYGTKM